METIKIANSRRGTLTGGRLLALNTFWNLVGTGAPMLVAVVCIPVLIRGLGKDRFGVLTLAWALIGYASLLDLGLGRALTQLVAQKLATDQEQEIPRLVWTSLLLMLILGLFGTAVVCLASPWLVHHALNVPVELQKETLYLFYLMGISIPVVISTAGLRGLLEAHQRFGLTAALRVPMGVFTFAGPLLALPISKSLVPVVATLVLGRILAWGAHLILCLRVLPDLRRTVAWDRSSIGPLLRFGGWMTVSNVISPLMVTLDRFLIGALVSMAAVAYYATPYEVVTKFWLIPNALMGVMFPAFSASFARERSRTTVLFGRSLKTLFLVLFPIMLCSVALSQEGLSLWLGSDFARHSFRVFQWPARYHRQAAFHRTSPLSIFALVVDRQVRDRRGSDCLDGTCGNRRILAVCPVPPLPGSQGSHECEKNVDGPIGSNCITESGTSCLDPRNNCQRHVPEWNDIAICDCDVVSGAQPGRASPDSELPMSNSRVEIRDSDNNFTRICNRHPRRENA